MTKLELYQSGFAAAASTLDVPAAASLDAQVAQLATTQGIPDADYVTWKAYVVSFRSQMLSLRAADQIASKLQSLKPQQ